MRLANADRPGDRSTAGVRTGSASGGGREAVPACESLGAWHADPVRTPSDLRQPDLSIQPYTNRVGPFALSPFRVFVQKELPRSSDSAALRVACFRGLLHRCRVFPN